MPLLTGGDERQPSNGESTSPSLRKHLRDAAVVFGLAGVAYVVMRYLESRENGRPLPQAIADRVEGTVPDEVELADGEPIEIDVPATGDGSDDVPSEPDDAQADESGPESDDTRADDSDASDDAVVDDERTSVDLTEDERSSEELENRTASDVVEEPAEPGEMTVDEEITDELVDDAEEGANDESNAQ
ncbi:hypothetical protein ACFO5R_07870 [Halosolutus amylolyticus]|uniref:Uncharacterized protein n=1 Tax=Halosolutus amylolyticus TaxID=2932267 RepID=A0ABD5PPP9_9EURY|nr:hypothetical protein [Halosolutus amylolyticus]